MQPWQLDHQVLQADDCGRSVSFQADLGLSNLPHQTTLGVVWSTDQQLQPCFHVVWSSSLSTVPQALQLPHNEVLFSLKYDLEIVFHFWVMKFVRLKFLLLGTFPLGRRLEGKSDFTEYQPMIGVAFCTVHHSGMYVSPVTLPSQGAVQEVPV